MVKLTHFDAADHLDNEETIAEYITAALDNPNPDAFLTAVRDVARARGMAHARQGCRAGHQAIGFASSPVMENGV